MNQAPNVQQAELTLTVIGGPDKGAVYRLVSAQVRIGRAVENDVVLKDPRCSRVHAMIELGADGITIANKSSTAHLEVDGLKTDRAPLKPGSQISIGNSVLRFDLRPVGLGQIPLPPPEVGSPQQMTSAPVSIGPQGGGLVPEMPRPVTQQNVHQVSVPSPGEFGQVSRTSGRSNNRIPLYGGVAVIGLLVFLLLGDQSQKSIDETELRTDSALEEDLKANQERLSNLEKEQERRGVGTQEYKEVQALLTQGLRDYREGQYGRALLSLDSALALRPDSEVARKYRDLSKRRFDELIQATMLEGKRYREQGKHRLAVNAYRQVMIFISDPKNKQYQEAEQLAKESELLIRGAY